MCVDCWEDFPEFDSAEFDRGGKSNEQYIGFDMPGSDGPRVLFEALAKDRYSLQVNGDQYHQMRLSRDQLETLIKELQGLISWTDQHDAWNEGFEYARETTVPWMNAADLPDVDVDTSDLGDGGDAV